MVGYGTMDASSFVQTVQNRQGVVISLPEEIAYYTKWITKEELLKFAELYGKSPYGEHLQRVAEERIVYYEYKVNEKICKIVFMIEK